MAASRHFQLLGMVLLLGSPLWLLAGALAIKAATFPFVEFTAEDAAAFDRSHPEFQALVLSEEFEEAVRAALPEAQELVAQGRLPEAASIAAAWVRRRFRHHDTAVLDAPEQALPPAGPVPAICSEYAKFYAATLQALGAQARVLWMPEHTITEIWDPASGEPFLADVNGNLRFRHAGGERLASFAELLEDPASPTAERLVPRDQDDPAADDPDYLSAGRADLLSRQTFAVEIEGARVFDFHQRNRRPGVLLPYLLGGPPVAQARAYRTQESPPLGGGRWMAWLAGVAALLQAAVGVGTLLRRRR